MGSDSASGNMIPLLDSSGKCIQEPDGSSVLKMSSQCVLPNPSFRPSVFSLTVGGGSCLIFRETSRMVVSR